MDPFSKRLKLVAPLGFVENHLLEVLLTQFSLTRRQDGRGAKLHVEFNRDTPAIWQRTAKNDVRRMISDFHEKSRKYQRELDDFLLNNRGSHYEFNDPDFPFRYASGGTLPILRFGKEEYYCLFFRDLFPIGWNIANGSCDTVEEMLNPLLTIERELREELLVIDPDRQKRYVFSWDAGMRLDRPEFDIARRIWQERFEELDFPNFQELKLPLKWLEGPDSIEVQLGENKPRSTTGCFLNITTEDFAIEIDKVARINVDDGVRLCDGEITEGRLVNRIVGLFPVEQLNRDVREGKSEFRPEKFFFDATTYNGGELDRVVEKDFLRRIVSTRQPDEIEHFRTVSQKYGLCPITNQIIRRYTSPQQQEGKTTTSSSDPEVFISFGGEDQHLARKVYEFLRVKMKRRVFLSEELHDYHFTRAIDEALLSAHTLVAVGTSPFNLNRRWPEYEYRSFHNYILNDRKPPEKRQLISFVAGFQPVDLPPPLYHYQAVVCDSDNIEAGLEKLASFIR